MNLHDIQLQWIQKKNKQLIVVTKNLVHIYHTIAIAVQVTASIETVKSNEVLTCTSLAQKVPDCVNPQIQIVGHTNSSRGVVSDQVTVCGLAQWSKSQLEEIYSSLFLINIKSFLPEGWMKRRLNLVFLLACNKVAAPMQDSHTQEIKQKNAWNAITLPKDSIKSRYVWKTWK